MENNSANFSLYVWVLSIWITPAIAILFAEFNSFQDNWDIGVLFLFILTTLPFLVLFILGNGVLYHYLKKDWTLRLVIYLFSMFMGLPILMGILRLNESLIQNTFYFIITEILLITILVWTLKIERSTIVRKQKLPPSRPDILDDNLE